MLSKNKIKLIQSLNRKKNRDETGLFLAEGNKMVGEVLRSDFTIDTVICTPEYLKNHPETEKRANEIIVTDSLSIQKASLLQNPQDALALVHHSSNNLSQLNLQSELCLALDFIQDPGNLGTILRIADWFGIKSLICSENTVDAYNPKVVQASMGAIFRTKVSYINLEEFLSSASQNQIPVYGTFLEGNNIYNEKLSKNGIILMGNEGNGISDSAGKWVSHKLYIPSFSPDENQPESLNVAVAAAICCSEFRRR
ncbi:MAG: RNA methyltransferase [Prolixibacteraceae bacterium]